jgi:hypothetical protein
MLRPMRRRQYGVPTIRRSGEKKGPGVFVSKDPKNHYGSPFQFDAGGKQQIVSPDPIWHADGVEIDHSNAVRSGDYLFASVGDAASFLSAISLKDGKQVWKKRGFSTANLIKVGDDFLLLDFEGELALVELSGDGMNVVSQATINTKPTWTPPTLLGTTLYFRDETRIAALDLSGD